MKKKKKTLGKLRDENPHEKPLTPGEEARIPAESRNRTGREMQALEEDILLKRRNTVLFKTYV